MVTFFQKTRQRITNIHFMIKSARLLGQIPEMRIKEYLSSKVKYQQLMKALKSVRDRFRESNQQDALKSETVEPTRQCLVLVPDPGKNPEVRGKANINDLNLIKCLKAEKAGLCELIAAEQRAFADEKSDLLKSLEHMQFLNEELKKRCERAEKQAEKLQVELDEEVKAHGDTFMLMTFYKTEQTKLQKPVEHEHIRTFKNAEKELLVAVDKVKTLCDEMNHKTGVAGASAKSEDLKNKNDIQACKEPKSWLGTFRSLRSGLAAAKKMVFKPEADKNKAHSESSEKATQEVTEELKAERNPCQKGNELTLEMIFRRPWGPPSTQKLTQSQKKLQGEYKMELRNFRKHARYVEDLLIKEVLAHTKVKIQMENLKTGTEDPQICKVTFQEPENSDLPTFTEDGENAVKRSQPVPTESSQLTSSNTDGDCDSIHYSL
ncbi:uncharacterized protein [Nothobranchius furzeri]|uniref:uncharacterized protein n=1 Tax=Nothobranchius furzeri TaxID=105023 RepID=UPI002404461A|nr:uncharacterized protein LOC107384383 [Nothobranchius furzeri]XP_054598233.1 uncharacterized protein LOC107384383 [Nothobranchius furzeri]